MERPNQDLRNATPELLAEYLAGKLDETAANSLRTRYGWTTDGTSVRDVVLETVQEEAEDVIVTKESLTRRLADVRQRVGVDGSVDRRPVNNRLRREPFASRILLGQLSLGKHALPLLTAVTVTLGIVMSGLVLSRSRPSDMSTKGHLYTTTTGQRVTLALIDGSRVTLAPQSRLIVAEGFGRQTRTVTLAGEAHFDVATATGAPFIVRTARVVTRVLGTEFDVRAYAGDPSARIAVVSGRITATNRRTATTLFAGSVADITDSTATTSASGDMLPYTSWTAGRLVFRDTPVSDVLTTVGRWYGYEFHLTDTTLAKRRIIATFYADNSAETLAAIEHLLRVTMSFDGSVVIVRPRRDRDESSPNAPVRRTTRSDLSPLTGAGK